VQAFAKPGCTNVSNSPTCHYAKATPFTVIVLSNMPGIDPMLQKFLKIDVLVDFVSNHIRVGVFLKLQQVQ
jgi:hypothetical protein